jgi:hypothetical protein
VAVSLGALILAGIVLIVVFGDAIIDGYGKGKLEQGFAAAYPGWVLRIGKLNYSLKPNRLVAHSVALSATNATLKIDQISLTGIRWRRLLWGAVGATKFLDGATLDATNLDTKFPQTHYGLRCARLRASVPGGELIAEGAELLTLAGDEEFFAAYEHRTTRFHIIAPECRVLGLAYGELFQGKSYRARSIRFSAPSFDALVNLDKPAEPFVKSPLMLNEALAAIPKPLQIDNLTMTNGSLTYRERIVNRTNPGKLTISAINISGDGIANRGDESAAIVLRAQGNLMEAGTIKLLMSMPISPVDFSLHYSGSLSAMDLTSLDPFLDIDALTRIKSGNVQDASFEITVTTNHARGHVQATYGNLELAVLDKQTGTEKGFDNRVATFLENALKIRSSNSRNASGSMREGEVNYTRKPDDEFQQFLWFALRTGVMDIITR